MYGWEVIPLSFSRRRVLQEDQMGMIPEPGKSATPEPPLLQPVHVPSAHQVVVNHLRRIIHLGKLQPGTKLPPERQLSAQLGVSRTTLREAMHILQVEGYVDISIGQQGGVFVRTTTFPTGQQADHWAKESADFKGVYDLRAVVEGYAARTVVSMESTDSIGIFRQEDLRYHLTIAEASELELLPEIVGQLRAALFMPFQIFELADMQASSVREHRQILDALSVHDAQSAGAFMTAHVSHSATAMMAAMESFRAT
jgi:GntR family transcriptional regulator, transcriptional repressor for pyruvate dehydrogenase complex